MAAINGDAADPNGDRRATLETINSLMGGDKNFLRQILGSGDIAAAQAETKTEKAASVFGVKNLRAPASPV